MTLPGDASKAASAYGPSTSAAAETVEPVATTEAKAVGGAAAAEEDDDEIDLFGSDDEEVDAEAEALKAKRLAEYAEKKAKKAPTVGKSVVTLDVKPCECDCRAPISCFSSLSVWSCALTDVIAHSLLRGRRD